MLINIDAKGLEWVTIVWLAQDPVGMDEIISGVDQHAVNQAAFGLPDRTTAKIFVFRLIYGGSKWAYCLDPAFNWISNNPEFWQDIIDKFYAKYKGIALVHKSWVKRAMETGELVMPTGRIYKFRPTRNKRGELEWPRTKILNYPVQGTGHDFVTVARVSLYKRIKAHDRFKNSVSFVSTVHDSIVLDIMENGDSLPLLVPIIRGVFHDINSNCNRLWGFDLNLPIGCDITYGPNLLDMQAIT